MKIVFFDLDEQKKKFFCQNLKDHHVQCFSESLSLDKLKLIEECELLSVRIFSQVTRDIIESLPHLKCIATQSTGYDHIDLDFCQQRGITVCNVPYYGENTVAEHTFALILALSRNVHKSYLRTMKGDFSIEVLSGFDLKDKTLGVIGTGRIGLHVIRIAKAFGMKVLAFDVVENSFLAEVLDFKYLSLDQVLSQSDIVSLHVPYNKKTHHMISEEAFAKLKKGALLVNTGRGKVLDTQALIKALDTGVIKGAALDVIEGENELIHGEKNDGLISKHPLLTRDNVVYTPHIASQSREAQQRILDTTLENIKSFALGECKNAVA